jgi:hypothetical protein
VAGNSRVAWCDWHSNGGLGRWGDDDPPEWRHTFFGIAPVGTARLTVTDETGNTRDLQITPWNVAIVAGAHSTLTGYDERGDRLGSFKPVDGFTEEPELRSFTAAPRPPADSPTPSRPSTPPALITAARCARRHRAARVEIPVADRIRDHRANAGSVPGRSATQAWAV